MKLIRLEARNFRSYKEVDIDFGKCRLIRIRGRNGVGKSAIVESLGWTIFGRLWGGSSIRDATYRLSPRDEDNRPEQAGHPSVTWTVEINGKRLRVSRWPGGARVEDGSPRPVVTGSRDVHSFLVEQLGMKYDDLRATAWCLQGEVRRPITMATQDRRSLIRRLLLGDRGSRTAGCDRDGNPEKIVNEARRSVKETRDQLDEVIRDLKEAEGQESGARERVDSMREAWRASLERHSLHEVLVATIAGLVRERDGLRHHSADCTANLRAMRRIEARVARFDRAALDEAVARLEDDAVELDCLETALQGATENRLARKATADARAEWYTDVAATLASAIATGECTTCGRRIWSGRATITGKLDHANVKAHEFRLQSDRANVPSEEEVELADDIRRVASEIDVLQDRQSELQYERGYCEAARALLSRNHSQATKHMELEAKIAETIERLEKCERDRGVLDYCEGEHERAKSDLSEAEVEWRKAMERAKELRTRREDLDQEYRQLVQDAMDVSAEAVGIDVHEEVRANLEQMTNDIVERLIRDDGTQRPFKVTIDSDFKPILHEDNGRSPRVSSGGLDVIVALAMRLALMRLVTEKRGQDRGSIGGVLILDEPFGSVDPQWREGLLKLLKTGEWRVSQVVEISSWHRDGGPQEAPGNEVDSRGHTGSDGLEEERVYTVGLADGSATVTEG